MITASKIKTKVKGLAAIALGLAGAVLLLEGLSRGCIGLNLCTWPTDSAEVNELKKLETEADPRNGEMLIHPYFGYVKNPRDPMTNNLGFANEYEIPDTRTPGEFLIGIFGGSVATQYANFEKKNRHLADRLTRLIPELRNKKVKILNFALGAGKQPQQYQIASFTAGILDLSINVDGFNEATFEDHRGIFPAYYPSHSQFYFSADNDSLVLIRLALWLKSVRDRVESVKTGSGWIPHSFAATLAFEGAEKIIALVGVKLYGRSEKAGDLPPALPPENLQAEEYRRHLVDLWSRYTYRQHRLAHEWQTRAFFFIQPNQYVPDSKILTGVEARTAIVPGGMQQKVPAQYVLLERARKDLQNKGVKIFNLKDVFKNTPEQVYRDSCCHLNDRGNEVMSDAIAEIIVKHW